jgi:hypothetical protein
MSTATRQLLQTAPTRRERAAAQERERGRRVAEFLLNEALSFGIRVGCALDASEMTAIIPMRVPRDVARWFEREFNKHQPAIIEFILWQNGIWPGASS